tara:strand:+ start:1176 stop:2090 length:915 start_codon:yes stop_codon:yes gene_type:complete
MTKTLYIHCDGGFGNRFNSLVAGLQIAKVGEFDPVILWPSTNWCRSSFSSIFKNEYNVIEQDLSYFADNPQDYSFIMHGHFSIPRSIRVVHPGGFSSIQHVVDFYNQSEKDKFVYNHDAIPPSAGWVEVRNPETKVLEQYGCTEEIMEVVRELEFSDQITNTAEVFLQHHEEFSGIHLRNTDFFDPHKPNFDELEQTVKDNPDIQYFICSDDQELEERFTQHDNAFAYPKYKYVEKLADEGEWRDHIEGPDGEEYSFNIERSDESVIDAMVDLLILSRSTIILTSESTFLKTALLMQYSNARQE